MIITLIAMLQHMSYAWAPGMVGGFLRSHLSLIFATLVTLVFVALGGVFMYISVDHV